MIVLNQYPHAVAAELELLGGLRRCPSGMSLVWWRRVLRCLRPHQRRVVVLRVLWGMGSVEVAERVGVTRAHEHSIWWKSLARLRRLGAVEPGEVCDGR